MTGDKNKFNFTVKQLIEVLGTMPQDLPILVSGYENGFENFYQPVIIELRHEPENLYYEGEFQIAKDGDGETFNAVILDRVMRYD